MAASYRLAPAPLGAQRLEDCKAAVMLDQVGAPAAAEAVSGALNVRRKSTARWA